MNCPVDNELLQMTERQGVEVDYCPRCRGVWLDRGELDKVIERGADEFVSAGDSDRGGDRDERYRRDDDRDRDRDDRDHGGDDYRRQEHQGKKRKKSSFLSEIFEFGG